jgi:AAA15 family ATPase/GTPase
MRITTVEIDGYLSFNNFKIQLEEKNIIVGTNGVGKSNFLKLLYLSVFNPRKYNNYFDSFELDDHINKNCENPFIKITFDFGNDKELIENIKKIVKLKYFCKFVSDSTQYDYVPKHTYPHTEELLNIHSLTFVNRKNECDFDD